MPNPFSNFARPTVSQSVLFALLMLACTVDYSRQVTLMGVSGLGALTLVAAGAVWSVWLMRPVLPRGLTIVFLPLILFLVDAVGTLLWYSPGKDGVQLLAVCLTFVATMMLAARETAAKPELASRLRTFMLVCSILPVGVCVTLLAGHIISASETNVIRPFSLYALVVAGVSLATWRWMTIGSGSVFKSLWPLLWVLVIAYAVFLSLSRTALIVILLTIPLALLYHGTLKSAWRGILILLAGAGGFAGLLYSSQQLYDRFFKEDASLKVGGVSINGSGRTHIWNLLLSTLKEDWIFGKGVSSSEDIISKYMTNVGQPHNDYLRFYYDQGAVGLALWLIFIAVFSSRTVGNLRRSVRNKSPDYPQHLAALLALTAVSLSMLTDNSYVYAFVMFPLAILMGSSLALGQQYAAFELPPMSIDESAYSQPLQWQAPPAVIARRSRSTRQ